MAGSMPVAASIPNHPVNSKPGLTVSAMVGTAGNIVRLAPRSDQEIRGFRDDCLERFPFHGITSRCGLRRGSRTHCRGEASFAQPADGGQCVLVSERAITPEVSVPGYTLLQDDTTGESSADKIYDYRFRGG